jgi:hypothetical protein
MMMRVARVVVRFELPFGILGAVERRVSDPL